MLAGQCVFLPLVLTDEKLMLYLIHKHAVQAEKSPNLGDKHERENDMVILERHTAWLISECHQCGHSCCALFHKVTGYRKKKASSQNG
eukprot:1156278-Pelagomonas_calceolata.AAC.5